MSSRSAARRPVPPRGLERLDDQRALRVRWADAPPREVHAHPAAVHLRAARTRRRALEPQVVPPDLPALVQEHGPLDDVGELPHVAGPGVGGEPRFGVGLEAFRPPVLLCRLGQEGAGGGGGGVGAPRGGGGGGGLGGAAVKAPRSKPKIADSRSAAGMAAQFPSTNGRSARGLRSWMVRATRPLPVPVSPVMRMAGAAACPPSSVASRSTCALSWRGGWGSPRRGL